MLLRNPAVTNLIRWYEKHQRDFPWRVKGGANPDAYLVWIAEIMSQQTQMSAVVPFFHRFLEKFPTVKALAKAPESDVLAAWAGLGYYSRARNVQKAAQAIVAGGGFPLTYEGWLELPGVGEYTAAAVVSQAFGLSHAVYDGNVQRVCSRLFARADVYTKNFKPEIVALLNAAMQGHSASHFNQAFMELGATVCTPKNPNCAVCPLSSECKAFALGKVSAFPPPKPRKETVEVNVRSLVCVKRDAKGSVHVLMRPRAAGEWFTGLWDFRSELGGVKNPRVALTTHEKIFSRAQDAGSVKHQITHHKIAMRALLSFDKAEAGTGEKWIAMRDLLEDRPSIPVSTTAKKVLKQIFKLKNDQLREEF